MSCLYCDFCMVLPFSSLFLSPLTAAIPNSLLKELGLSCDHTCQSRAGNKGVEVNQVSSSFDGQDKGEPAGCRNRPHTDKGTDKDP